MIWHSPDAWIDACGTLAAGLREDYKPRGGEDALADALDADPRRLVALVGAAGAGASRLALEIARHAPAAFYLNPALPPNPEQAVAELTALLSMIPPTGRPVVVLDSPCRDEALASLSALLVHAIHPRLAVLVPCNTLNARRLGPSAGGYPAQSTLVVSVQGDGTPPRRLSTDVATGALLPFALVGRCKAGLLDGEQALVDQRLLARDEASGTVACLLDDRSRHALVSDGFLFGPDGPGRLSNLLSAHPVLRDPALVGIARQTGGNVPDKLLGTLVAFDATDFPDTDNYRRRAVDLSPAVYRQLSARAEALIPTSREPDRVAALEAHLAGYALACREEERCEQLLLSALARAIGPAMRGRLLEMLARVKRDGSLYTRAADCFRECHDHQRLAGVLRRVATRHHREERFDEAMDACLEALAIEEAHGSDAAVGACVILAARIAGARHDPERERPFAERALAICRATGEAHGRTQALYRLANIHTQSRQPDRVQAVTEETLELERVTGNLKGQGYCLFVLGALADKRAQPAQAAEHYAASIEAYEAGGHEPHARVRSQLAQARRRAEGEASQRGADGNIVPLAEDAPG